MTETEVGMALVTLAKGVRAIKALMDLSEAEAGLSFDEARITKIRNVVEKDYRFAEFTRALALCESIPNPPDGDIRWPDFHVQREGEQ